MLNFDWTFIGKSFHLSKSNQTPLKEQKFNKSKRFSFKVIEKALIFIDIEWNTNILYQKLKSFHYFITKTKEFPLF
jgi:hypothetical protein